MTYSLRKRRCLAIAHKTARAAFPRHLKISAKHGGDESLSSNALQTKADGMSISQSVIQVICTKTLIVGLTCVDIPTKL